VAKLEWLREQGYTEDHLAILVEDQKCQSANRINNKGLEKQLDYLLTTMEWDELVGALRHERKILRRYGMASQSKLHPEKNLEE
jgi:hypothetical protein